MHWLNEQVNVSIKHHKNVADTPIENNTSPKPNSDLFIEEWKAARSTIDKYDKILVDWRKTGFSIVAGLTTAAGILRYLISNPVIFAAMIFSTMVFVSLLYWIDRYYYNLSSGAMIRARFLEAYRLDSMKLNIFTGGFFSGQTKSVFLVIYIAIAGTILLLGVVTYYQESLDSVAQINQLNINKTGIQSNLSDTQILKEIDVQKKIDNITQQQYSGLFLPILIGAVGATSAIMVIAYCISSHRRHEIMRNYECLRNIFHGKDAEND